MKVSTDACLFGAWLATNCSPDVKQVLDIGSGTGLLMLMLAQKTSCLIHGIEKDTDAYEQANENIRNSKWGDRLKNFHGDIRTADPGKYDFIICNPPFHSKQLLGPVDKKKPCTS